MKILVCDDEALIRNVIKEYSLNEGYTVYEAENGEEAINILLEKDVDVVILDIMMPKKDGITAIKEIKEIKDVPVIMLSARTMEFDKLNSFDIITVRANFTS